MYALLTLVAQRFSSGRGRHGDPRDMGWVFIAMAVGSVAYIAWSISEYGTFRRRFGQKEETSFEVPPELAPIGADRKGWKAWARVVIVPLAFLVLGVALLRLPRG